MKPAWVNRALWFSQLGLLTATVAFGKSLASTSAPVFRAPVPPMLWSVAARFWDRIGAPFPNSSSWTASRNGLVPSIGR